MTLLKKGFEFVQMTVVNGFFVVLPIVLVALLLSEIVGVMEHIVAPIVEKLPVEEIQGVSLTALVLIVAIALLFLVVGLAIQTPLGTRINEWVERIVLSRLPGFSLLKNLTQRFSPSQDRGVAVLRLSGSGAGALALVVEELPDGRLALFVPMAPTPTVGSLYIAERTEVELLPASTASALTCFTQWGIGAAGLFEGNETVP